MSEVNGIRSSARCPFDDRVNKARGRGTRMAMQRITHLGYKEKIYDIIEYRLWVTLFRGTDSIELVPYMSITVGGGCYCPGQIIISFMFLTFGAQITINRD